eukprot:3047706-Pyramimonas_sp.AAC.1
MIGRGNSGMCEAHQQTSSSNPFVNVTVAYEAQHPICRGLEGVGVVLEVDVVHQWVCRASDAYTAYTHVDILVQQPAARTLFPSERIPRLRRAAAVETGTQAGLRAPVSGPVVTPVGTL